MCRQVLRNQRNEPLLVAGNANNDAENPQVVLKFPPGIPSVSLRCASTSSERKQSKRKEELFYR